MKIVAVKRNFEVFNQLLIAEKCFYSMRKIFLMIFAGILFFNSLAAQERIEVYSNTLQDQMTEVFEKSNSYQDYKVIKKAQLAALRKSVTDSIRVLEQQLLSQKEEMRGQKNKLDSLALSLKNTQEQLTVSEAKEDSISVLGFSTSKSAYNFFMWGIIIVLLLISSFLFYRFSGSHRIIGDARVKIDELEEEMENYRRTSLEREQRLNRRLQDEINKNREI